MSKCPDCGSAIKRDALRCPCGWKAADAIATTADPLRDVRARMMEAANASAAAYCERVGRTRPASASFAKPSADWAIAVMARADRGEDVPIAAQEKARHALSASPVMREPGEDREESA